MDDFCRDYILKNNARLMVRAAREDDAAALDALLRAAGGESDNLSFGAEDYPYSVEIERARIAQARSAPGGLMLLAFVNDAPAAYLSLLPEPRRFCRCAELAICVRKAYWRQGVGRILMQEAISQARACGALHSIFLTVNAENAGGIRLYRECGFREYGRYCEHAWYKGAYHDTLLMNLYLEDPS